MISAEQKANIQRLFHGEHWKIGTIAAELGLHPDTVRTALEVERFRQGPAPRAALTDPYLGFIRRTLEQHPRLRATRLYEMLRDRGFSGSVVQPATRRGRLASPKTGSLSAALHLAGGASAS